MQKPHTPRVPRRILCAALGACLIVLSACGGDDSSGSSSTTTTTTSSTAPSITTQPASVSVSTGSSASFSVVASGSSLTYQWYFGSTAISGAAAATYSISSVASSDAGSYYVIVSNAAGSVTSSSVTLSIVAAAAAACDTAYVDSLLTAISNFESALGTSLTASTLYSGATYTTAQLNVYKTDWSNLPPGAISFSRPGITLSQLTSATQISAFNALVSTALSGAGYTDYQGVLAADDYLGYTENANGYGADLYHVAFVGTPSETNLWTLMLGGHHMAFNITFYAGCAYPTPHHIGVEPRTAFTSNTASSDNFYTAGTYQVLASKAAAMSAIFSGLSSSELARTFLTGQTFSDMLIGPVEADTGSYATVTAKFTAIAASSARGVLVSSLTTAQQALVTAAVEQFVNDYDSVTAARLLADYENGYATTYVAWANAAGTFSSSGPDITASETYMRIDGPRIWIEMACQAGIVIQGQTHYHMMFRDKTYDYYNELSD